MMCRELSTSSTSAKASAGLSDWHCLLSCNSRLVLQHHPKSVSSSVPDLLNGHSSSQLQCCQCPLQETWSICRNLTL